MSKMPAFCDECGKIFPSGFNIENSIGITFTDCSGGACPFCGHEGHIPDGVYNFIGNTIELLTGPERTIKELQKLKNIITNSRGKNLSPEQIKIEIEKEIPELSSLMDIFPKNRIQLYAFITLIVLILNSIMYAKQSGNKTDMTTNHVINNVYQMEQNITYNTDKQLKAKNHQPIPQKIGRNQQCPCDSGIKFKKCCGNN